MKYSKYNIIMKSDYDEESYILFNSLTGATFKIDSGIKETIEKKNLSLLDDDNLELYKKHRIIIENDFSEDKYYEYFYNKNKFNNDVLNLTVLLTQACNLKCVYCFQGAGNINDISLSDTSRAKIYNFIVNQIKIREPKVLSMLLFGGEPLLNFKTNTKWLDSIKKLCEEKGIHFVTSIVTNGTLVNDTIIDQLKEYNCSYVQITLDGVKEIHDSRRMSKNGSGSFENVIKGIKTISKRDDFIKPLIRINIDKNNISQTHDLLRYLSEENLTDCGIDFGIVRGGTEACAAYSGHCFKDEEIGDVLKDLWTKGIECGFNINPNPSPKTLFCGLYGDSAFTIAPNGDLYKCWEHVGDKKHLMGKLDLNGDIVDVTFAYFDWMSRNPLNTKACKECSYLPACGGGCGSVSYEKEGSYHSTGCFQVKGVIEKQINFKFKQSLETTKV